MPIGFNFISPPEIFRTLVSVPVKLGISQFIFWHKLWAMATEQTSKEENGAYEPCFSVEVYVVTHT